MKFYIALVVCLFSSSAYAQCKNCKQARQQVLPFFVETTPVVSTVVHVPVRQSVPAALVQKTVRVPQALVQKAVQVPAALVRPATTVVVQTTRTVPVVGYVPRQQVYTPQVYNTQSFHSNGSGQSLADHLRLTHGVDPTGMSVAEQEAKHREKHGYGTGSVSVSVSSFLRPRRWFR